MSGDLHAAVEGLPPPVNGELHWSAFPVANCVSRSAVLALIPEGAVLVTEAELAAALGQYRHTREEGRYIPPLIEDDGGRYRYSDAHEFAAAILRHLREGT